MEYKKHSKRLRHFISIPLTWAPLIPLVILDLFIEIYHRICFPLCGIPLVKRSNYIRIDRYKLPYLNWFEKINCVYCGYANGLLHYTTVIAGETEKYWCGIMHDKYKNFVPPKHHKDFLKYGDEKSFKNKYLSKKRRSKNNMKK